MQNPNHALRYWENKILKWEQSRYSRWLIFSPFSWTIRYRLSMAAYILKKRLAPGSSVLELGCGSGYLASKILDQIVKYVGVDIASNATQLAKKKNTHTYADFITADITQYHFEEFTTVVFLGLTDWLTTEELDNLFKKIKAQNLFFSYTETSVVSFWNPYKYYRKIIDRKSRANSYAARTYSENEISKYLKDNGYKFEFLKRASVLDPGVLVWAKK